MTYRTSSIMFIHGLSDIVPKGTERLNMYGHLLVMNQNLITRHHEVPDRPLILWTGDGVLHNVNIPNSEEEDDATNHIA